MTLDVKYKDHPRSNISYLIVVLKIWWYVNRCLMFLAINVFFCVTDNWQNNIWHESAYKVEVYTIEFLQEKKKKCTCWHSLTLSGILWRPNCEHEHKQWGNLFQWCVRQDMFWMALHNCHATKYPLLSKMHSQWQMTVEK